MSLLPRRSDVPAKGILGENTHALEVVAIEVPTLHVVLKGQRVDLRSKYTRESYGPHPVLAAKLEPVRMGATR